MFYAHIILAKKGPLARVWLAAHWDKKITKAHVFETNIEKSVEGIMQPKVKLALRTSGHLLLGVVRIYSRKAKYLLADCNEAFVKIKMAFRPGMVDLPEGHREANVNAITLPEVFHDFDTALPELNDIDIEAQFSINQSRADEITMREDYGSLSLSLHDDGFGDMGFEGDTPDMMRAGLDANINDQLFEDEVAADVDEVTETNIAMHEVEIGNTRLDADGFGDDFGQPELFEDDLFAETPMETKVDKVPSSLELPADNDSDDGVDHFDTHAASPMSSCADSPVPHENDEGINISSEPVQAENADEIENNNLDQSTLLQNEDESFALAPVDASAYKGVTKTKRKRKLIVDEVKNISGEEMKAQLANTSDIVTTLDLAPPTKRLMYWKETGGVEKLFSLPSRSIPARVLVVNYNRHLLSHFTVLEDFSCLGPSDLLALENIQQENESPSIIQNKRGRKRKIDIVATVQQQPNITTALDSSGDNTLKNLSGPEAVRSREDGVMGISGVALDVPAVTSGQDSLLPTTDATLMGGGGSSMRSPEPMFCMNDMDHLASLNDLPLTPGHLHHDTADDFNHGDNTPAGLHHGEMTPRHVGLDAIELIPSLPADQVSSILQEAENMGRLDMDRNDLNSDWNDYDTDNPAAIRIHTTQTDEQMENETSEQFEERVLNKRAAQLFYSVKTHLIKQESLLLSDFTHKNSRKQAAQKFYSLLVLKKFRALNISQSSPYEDIIISRGPSFENPQL